MAGDDVEVYPAGMRVAGDGLSGQATQLASAWHSHAATVTAKGDIFGDDPVGSLIGASYWAAHQIAGRSYASVAQNFTGLGNLLHATADDYDSTDTTGGADIAGLTGTSV